MVVEGLGQMTICKDSRVLAYCYRPSGSDYGKADDRPLRLVRSAFEALFHRFAQPEAFSCTVPEPLLTVPLRNVFPRTDSTRPGSSYASYRTEPS